MAVRKALALSLLVLACSSCAAHKTNFVYEIPKADLCPDAERYHEPQLIDEDNGQYYVWSYRGEYYVFGSKESSDSFRAALTFPGMVEKKKLGPYRETVYFESRPEDKDYQKGLQKRFDGPKLLRYQWDDYFVWKVGKHFYLFGDELTSRRYEKFQEFPEDREVIYKAGPHGENVIYEVKASNPDFSKFLLERYTEGPKLIRQSCENFTVWKFQQKYYVIGSQEMNRSFETYGELPNSQAYLSLGPGGETVIFEDDPDNPTLVAALKQRFEQERHLLADAKK